MFVRPRRVILRNWYSPGDLVMLSAAVRDLHRAHPGRFLTDVRTPCPDLWRHNPYLTPLTESDPGVETLECSYPLIQHSNTRLVHCLNGFIDFVGRELAAPCVLTQCRGDLHLSRAEKAAPSGVARRLGRDVPYWLIAAGGKFDYTIKWWSTERYQAVVDHFRDRVLFVQVGQDEHHHPGLRGVLDLRGRTTLRQLLRLVYRAQGVLCPVTSLMHFAAAVETPPGAPPLRPCVVVAGGREPPHWEAYPGHQFVHTVGMLPCCARGGCWRSRTRPLGDGDERDSPERVCVDVVGDLPHCMHLITAAEIIRRIELYLAAGALPTLDRAGAGAARRKAARRPAAGPRE